MGTFSPIPNETDHSDKTLYLVTCTLDIEMLVLAKDEDQAIEIGKHEWHEELSNAGIEPDHFMSDEVTSKNQVMFYGQENLDAATPYGPKGQSSPQMTITEWLNSKGIT